MIFGRFLIAAFTVCVVALPWAPPAQSSFKDDAGRTYAVASRRLAELRKSPKNKKYRSYWNDCIRTFELLEKKYPKSRRTQDACFDRADIYRELSCFSGSSKDSDEAIRIYGSCRSAYPRHARAAEALYRVIELSPGNRKGGQLASEAYARLARSYPRSQWTEKAGARMKPAGAGKKRKPPSRAAREKAAPGGVIREIRYRSGGDYTRVVIEHEEKMNFSVLELKTPDRLVFDLQDARLEQSVDTGPLLVNDGILRQVRASQFTPGTVRVVLDLANIKSYAAFPLREPRRLVIDVMGETRAGDAFAASGRGRGSAGSPVTLALNAPPVSSHDVTGAAGLSLSRQLGLKIRTIAIDAGHGGRDPGAIGKLGTREKTVTLDIAKRLAVLVKEGLGCAVVMTRDRDEFIPLEDRPAIARTKGADLFVSIHVNASRKRRVRGIETYIQGLRASDLDAMATAARENATTAKTLGELDDELSMILAGLRLESNDEDSIHLAHSVQSKLTDVVKPYQGRGADLGVKRAFFYVLINTGMPSILAEVGFISNPTDEKLLMKSSYRQMLAEALYQGIKQYVEARAPQMADLESPAS